jgi:hypothetical protein
MKRPKMDLDLKEGALHRMLGLPKSIKKFPEEIYTLLEEIKEAPLDSEIINKTGFGKEKFTVTHLLKERAVLAINMKNWDKKAGTKKGIKKGVKKV